jgi:hypothetical protein
MSFSAEHRRRLPTRGSSCSGDIQLKAQSGEKSQDLRFAVA